MDVEAGDHGIFFAAGLDKCFPAADFDLFEGFQAVADEGRAENEELFYPLLRHFLQPDIGEGFQPAFTQAGLEGVAVFAFGYVESLYNLFGGGKALVTIAECVGRRSRIAAGCRSHAMIAGRVGFLNVTGGNAVIAKEDVIVAFFEIGPHELAEGIKVMGFVVKWLDKVQLKFVAFFTMYVTGVFDCGFVGGHGIMRVERNGDDLFDLRDFFENVFVSGFHGRVAVAHGDLNGSIYIFLERFLQLTSKDNEG